MKRFADRFFLVCLAAVLLAVPAWTLAKSGHNTVSFYENRMLAARPAWDWEQVLEGGYFTDWETWYSDHAPGRTTLLRAAVKLDMEVLKRPVVNDVVVSGGVLLPFLKYGHWDTDFYADKAVPFAQGYAALAERVRELGGGFWFVGFPEQSTYFYDRYPPELDNRRWNAQAASAAFYGALGDRGVAVIDMAAVYEEQGRPAAYYSTVDHHFAWRGAFAAYQAVLDRIRADTGLNLPVTREEDVEIQALPNPYLGSRSRKLYGLWPAAEQAEIGVLKNPIPFTRMDDGKTTAAQVYALPESGEQTVTYELYMGGDHGETVVCTDRPELPNALIFGDSFTNALETVFYTSFNETRSLDLRYYTEKSLREYIEEYRPQVVVCVRNDTSFYTDDGNSRVWDGT